MDLSITQYCMALNNLAKVMATIASAEWAQCTATIVQRLSTEECIWNRDPLFVLYKLENAFLAFAERIVTYRHPDISTKVRAVPSSILEFSFKTFQFYYDNIQFTKDEEERYTRLAMVQFKAAWNACRHAVPPKRDLVSTSDSSKGNAGEPPEANKQQKKKLKKEILSAPPKKQTPSNTPPVCMLHLLYILKVPDANGTTFKECGYSLNNHCTRLHLETADKTQVCALLADPGFKGRVYFIKNKQHLRLLPLWKAAAAAWP